MPTLKSNQALLTGAHLVIDGPITSCVFCWRNNRMKAIKVLFMALLILGVANVYAANPAPTTTTTTTVSTTTPAGTTNSTSTSTTTPAATNNITAVDAVKYIGQNKTVCGTVASTNYAPEKLKTYLNIDKAFPDQVFTAVIEGQPSHDTFKTAITGNPSDFYKTKNVCVTGQIIDYKGKPQIMLTTPTQVKVN